jgi:hypothetical protein
MFQLPTTRSSTTTPRAPSILSESPTTRVSGQPDFNQRKQPSHFGGTLVALEISPQPAHRFECGGPRTGMGGLVGVGVS